MRPSRWLCLTMLCRCEARCLFKRGARNMTHGVDTTDGGHPQRTEAGGLTANGLLRRQITVIMDEMTVLTIALQKHGIDPNQREDREAKVVVKRIIERAYGHDPRP